MAESLSDAANRELRRMKRLDTLSALEDAITQRGKDLGMSSYETNKVYEAARREYLGRESGKGAARRSDPRIERKK